MTRTDSPGIVGIMHDGDVILDRFVLQTKAGSGGMGTVWKASDHRTGQTVALKVLREPDDDHVSRFLHEAHVLSTLDHPHIVKHIQHGRMPEGVPYMVMEWLEGDDLASRLARQELTVDETMKLIIQVARALDAAHARGVVHRDIKPSNLFLVRNDVSTVKVLDFGIARLAGVSGPKQTLTQTGSILGTPGYMSPEQARGERELSPTTDIFSLGCVLFECLTGQPAFHGMHLAALLAKLLFDEPPNLLEVRPDLPEALGMLVSQMLAKNPAERPVNAKIVQTMLDVLESKQGPPTTQRTRALTTTLTSTERRLVSIVAASPKDPVSMTSQSTTTTVDKHHSRSDIDNLRQAIAPMGAKLEILANGMFLAVIIGTGNPSDRATAAARCALRIRALLPQASMALLMERSDTSNRLPLGDVLEKVAVMIDAPHPLAEHGIRIDDVTQALLDTRFEVIENNRQILLLRERAMGEEPRTLLGKASPFVGRDRELRHLQEQIEDAFHDQMPRAILVTGSAGIGKSRLRQELLRRLGDTVPNLASIAGRADSLSAGAAFASVGSALRSRLGIEAGEPVEQQREKLATAVKRDVSSDDAQQIIDFIGELLGIPFPDENRPRLRAARQNAQIMADQIELAYLDFMRALVQRQPVLFVLEDLHWGDSASVRLLDAALRDLDDQPLVVLAFARPEVHDLFPKLWSSRNSMEIRLVPLKQRAAEALVKSMLGESVGTQTANAIIERSGGNAFYLEELIRAVATGHKQSLPDTVLGMVEARLGALPAESRRLLRAASIFGETFWVNGLRTLIGDEKIAIQRTLEDLVNQEFVASKSSRRFAGEDEYGFRHALVREGAYAMLTKRDRALGHKLAGEWLERTGEQDPLVLATHFELGGERDKTAEYYALVSERILRGGDTHAAIRAVDRALAAEPTGEFAAQLWVIRSEAIAFSGGADAYLLGLKAAHEALRLTTPDSRIYHQALFGGLVCALFSNQVTDALKLAGTLLTLEPKPGQVGSLAGALAVVAVTFVAAGQLAPSAAYIERLRRVVRDHGRDEPLPSAWEATISAQWELLVERNPWSALKHYRRAQGLFDLAGDRPNANAAVLWQGACLPALGAFEETEETLQRALRNDVAGTGMVTQTAKVYLVLRHVERGDPHAAIREGLEGLKDSTSSARDIIETQLYLLLGDAYVMVGDVDAAERALVQSAAGVSGAWKSDMTARGLKARILLARGQAAEAAREADETLAVSRNAGVFEWARYAATFLTRAEAHHAAGDVHAAKDAIREARDDLLMRAAKIDDFTARQTFLERLPVHTRTLALAREWLGD